MRFNVNQKWSLRVFAIAALGIMLASPFVIPSFTSQSAAGAANACVAPQPTAWVVDSGNNRILEFIGPFYSGMAASAVIGQPNFVTSGRGEGNHGGSINASTLSSPTAIAMDSAGNVWVADSGNNRVLEFSPPFKNGMAATAVLGQSTFTAGSDSGESEHQYHSWSHGQNPSQNNLFFPTAIAVDPSGNVWVADQGNNRIVEYKPTSYSALGLAQFTSGQPASLALGAKDFQGDSDGNWRDSQNQPASMAFDSSGNLWVSDTANNRIVEYVPPFATGMAASVAIGQPSVTVVEPTGHSHGDYGGSSWDNSGTNANQSRLSNPFGIAFDADGNLWVADQGNNRILEFKAPFATDMLASQVLGQSSSFTTGSQNNGGHGDSDSFQAPGQIAFDGTGNLWVTDAQNSRILVYQPPLWGGSVATMVLGQPANFQATSGGVGQNSVSDPNGILVTAPGTNSFKLSWIRQVDTVSRSTIFVTAPPADSVLSHAFVALSGAPAIYVVRVSDGTVLYSSQAFNVQGSQYGLIPNQQFTLSGLGVPVAEYGNSFNVAWVTTGGRSPTSFWLFVAAVPVNQNSLPTNPYQAPANTQVLSLNNLRDPATNTLISLNPVSLAFTADGSYILVGGTNGYVAGFVRSCPH